MQGGLSTAKIGRVCPQKGLVVVLVGVCTPQNGVLGTEQETEKKGATIIILTLPQRGFCPPGGGGALSTTAGVFLLQNMKCTNVCKITDSMSQHFFVYRHVVAMTSSGSPVHPAASKLLPVNRYGR